MTSEREDGLNQRYATTYRPLSTATILDSQVVEAEEEVIDIWNFMEPAMSRRVVGMS